MITEVYQYHSTKNLDETVWQIEEMIEEIRAAFNAGNYRGVFPGDL